MAEIIASILNLKGRQIWSVNPNATVYEAIAAMAERSIGAVLVMEGDRLVGILSERDYARKVILQGRSSKDTRVREIMTGELQTVSPEVSVDECMRIMTNKRIRHLPVIDQGMVVGVVSLGDLVRSTIAEQAATINHLHTYIAGIGR